MDSTNNIYLQKIAGEYSGDLPEPHSANGRLLKQIAEQGDIISELQKDIYVNMYANSLSVSEDDENYFLCVKVPYTQDIPAAIISECWYDAVNKKLVVASTNRKRNTVFQKALLCASPSTEYNPETDGELRINNCKYRKGKEDGSERQYYTYIWSKTSVNVGDVWYLRSYLEYKDDNDKLVCLYGDTVKVTVLENGEVSVEFYKTTSKNLLQRMVICKNSECYHTKSEGVYSFITKRELVGTSYNYEKYKAAVKIPKSDITEATQLVLYFVINGEEYYGNNVILYPKTVVG